MRFEIIFKNKRKTKAVNAWSKILNNWIKVHKKYMEECKGDNAYNYNERASLSMLAASIWISKGIAIEEYRSEKRHLEKFYSGRVDLWFQIEDFYCVVESKQIMKRLVKNNIGSITVKINNKLEEARSDVIGSMHNEKNGYAVVFFTPSILVKKPIDFNDILNQVKNTDFDFIAYVKGNEENHYDNPQNPTRIFPAGFIIGKRVLED